MDSKRHVSLYTDGSCFPNPGRGGYAAIVLDGRQRKEVSGGIGSSTNNRAELIAVIKGLSQAASGSAVTVHTDSGYVARAFAEGLLEIWKENGWRRIRTGEPVQNADLWKMLADTIAARNLSVTFHKLAAHRGHPLNERADYLARKAAREK